jgi:CDP-diacylglycerol--serine O-phosphatidyltransferase
MIKLLSPADIISLANATFGFFAILILISPLILQEDIRIQISFSLILLAMLADGLDGIVARRTRHGELGEYLEAMADMTSLGIAPAVFLYSVCTGTQPLSALVYGGLLIVLLIFLLCSIIRLSSFHKNKHPDFFVGLPASAGTIILLVLGFINVPLIYIVLVLFVISLAMISPIRFLKPGWKMNLIAFFLIVLSIGLRHTYLDVAPLTLFVALLVYTVVGPFYLKIRPQKKSVVSK